MCWTISWRLDPASAGEVVEIGGADVISYSEMLTFYAEVAGSGAGSFRCPC